MENVTKKLIHENDYLKYYLEDHGKWARITYTGNDGVLIVLQTNEDYVLVEHERQTAGLSLEIVRGFVENNETPEQAVIRELKEEIGLTPAQLRDIKPCGFIVPDNSITDRRLYVYQVNVRDADLENAQLQKEEGVINLKKFDIDMFQNILVSDLITDTLTLAAFSKIRR